MLVSALLIAAAEPASTPKGSAPVVINLLPAPCADDGGADVTVCAPRPDNYRIDPGVLAGERAVNAISGQPSERERSEMAVATSCHEQLSKCQGSGIIPLLPIAKKAIEVATLIAKDEDWREALRTEPDEYKAYKAERERRKVRVGIGLSAGANKGE